MLQERGGDEVGWHDGVGRGCHWSKQFHKDQERGERCTLREELPEAERAEDSSLVLFRLFRLYN